VVLRSAANAALTPVLRGLSPLGTLAAKSAEENIMKRTILVVGVAIVVLAGCVTHTNVTFESEPPGAEVYLDNRLIGETPVTQRLSNVVWNDYRVRMVKEGYTDAVGSVDKDLKEANLVFGLLLWWPSLFWVHGPDEVQYFNLIEE
jgi:hypothetical protein